MEIIDPISPSPVPRDATATEDDAAVLTAARRFVHAMLTYSYRRPERLSPLSRVGDLVTHAYTMRLQPRHALDPALAQATHETSSVRLRSTTIARHAPRDAGIRYAAVAYKQTLTQDGRRETFTRIWQIRLLRFGTSDWRIDDVTQAS
jgi:hypothetical protein